MNIKTKKQNVNKIVRLETFGEIKEIFVKEDLLNPKDALISVCFRGKSSSGIIELTFEEIEGIYKSGIEKTGLEGIKVMKFKN